MLVPAPTPRIDEPNPVEQALARLVLIETLCDYATIFVVVAFGAVAIFVLHPVLAPFAPVVLCSPHGRRGHTAHFEPGPCRPGRRGCDRGPLPRFDCRS